MRWRAVIRVNITEIMANKDTEIANFQDYLHAYAAQVGDLLNAYIPLGSHSDMGRYLFHPLLEYSQNGGKRHRPLICFAACLAVGGDIEKATSAAAAIEHFHTAALIHDDIADEAQLRRGQPCLHLTEGTGIAINCGDLALFMVNDTVIEDESLEDSLKLKVLYELIQMTRRTVEGQALDIGWARDGRYDLTEEDYLTMAIHKTAHYSGAVPLALGAMIGGADEATVEALRSYGLDTGLAFQIQDDLLNLIGTKEATKKDFRGDITEGKRTLVVIHALNNARPENRRRLIEILSARTDDVALLQEAVDILQASGSIEYAKSYAFNLTREAKKRLEAALPESVARAWLIDMADWFVDRLQ